MARWVGAARPLTVTWSLECQFCASVGTASETAVIEAISRPGVDLASSLRRAASFTGSPMTVYSCRRTSPTVPATTMPAVTPMPL